MAHAPPDRHEPFYVVGGNLHPDAPSYVRRHADDAPYDALSRGEFCYILTSRQMGKSSLIVRTGTRLAQDGVHVVTLDLTGIGQNLTPEQWYSGLLLNIGRRLDLEDELDDFWEERDRLSPVQRLVEALHRVVLLEVEGRIVLFLDEIDVAQSLPFSPNEFFAAIRHCYTRRAEDPDFERLSFCLAGVATPSDLIDDPLTTPFNIGTRIEVTDFAEAEAARLAEGLGRDADAASALIHRVLHWTRGHPYLTQRMCQAVQADESVRSDGDVDKLCEELFFSERAREQEPNLQFVRNTMLWRDVDHAALLSIYRDVVRGRDVPNDETDPLTGVLRLAGIVRVEAGQLRARNAIYEHVFDRAWVRESMPDAEIRRQRVAAQRAFLRTAAGAAVVVALLAAFAWYAVQGRRDAVRIGAMAQADKGRMMLRDSDVNGLLYLAEARKSADGMPELAESIAEEWALWHWQLDGRLMQDFGHDAEVTAMAFSPDGRLFATGAVDGTARLWDTITGEPHGQPLAHGSPVGQEPHWVRTSRTAALVCFSPDGTLVAIGGQSGGVTVWNADATTLHLRPRLRDGDRVQQMTFASDGSLVAYGTTRTGSSLWRWGMAEAATRGDETPLRDLADGQGVLTRDGSRLVGFDNDIGFAVVDTTTADALWHMDGPATLTSVAWSESFITAGTFDSTIVRVHDPLGGLVRKYPADALSEAPARATQPVQVDPTSDNETVLSVTYRGLKLWDLRTGEPVGKPIAHDGWVVYRAISADNRLVAGAVGSTVHVWDTETGEPTMEPILHAKLIKGLAFHPRDPRTLAILSADRSVRLWDVGPSDLHTVLASHPDSPVEAAGLQSSMVAFSPTASLVATSSDRDSAVAMRNVITGEPYGKPFVHEASLGSLGDARPPSVEALAFSPDGNLLATADSRRGVSLWDVQSGSRAAPVQEGRAGSMAFTPDGAKLTWLTWGTVGWDGGLRTWDMGAGKPTSFPYAPAELLLPGDPGGVDFSATGERVLLVSHQGAVTVFVTQDMRRVGPQINLTGRSDCARWSPDDSLILTSSENASAQLWDATTRRPAGPPMSHRARVRWANFSPDGRYIGTASDDRTAQLWNVATGQRVGLPLRHTSSVLCIEFSPDGRYLATAASQDARLWRLPDTPETLEEVQRETALATGQRLDEQGAVEPLGWREWQALRAAAHAQ